MDEILDLVKRAGLHSIVFENDGSGYINPMDRYDNKIPFRNIEDAVKKLERKIEKTTDNPKQATQSHYL